MIISPNIFYFSLVAVVDWARIVVAVDLLADNIVVAPGVVGTEVAVEGTPKRPIELPNEKLP